MNPRITDPYLVLLNRIALREVLEIRNFRISVFRIFLGLPCKMKSELDRITDYSLIEFVMGISLL